MMFLFEGGYVGKIPRNHPNMRTDVNGFSSNHHPIQTLHTLPEPIICGNDL